MQHRRRLSVRLLATLAACALAAPSAAQFTTFGQRCPGFSGTVPTPSPAGSGPASTPGIPVVGTSNTTGLGQPLPLDLTSLGLPGCSLFVSLGLLIPFATASNGKANTLGPSNLRPGRYNRQWSAPVERSTAENNDARGGRQ